MSRGRKTDRVVYVMNKRNLPDPKAGAEWVADNTFNPAEEVLRDPSLKDVFKSAIDNSSAVVMQKK